MMDSFPNILLIPVCPLGQVVDYFDGNTVMALWNYAQHFAISDNSFNTTFGPSSPGAVNLVSGQTHGRGGIFGRHFRRRCGGHPHWGADPLYDDCACPDQVGLSGKNIGDLLKTAASFRQLQCVDPSDGFLRVADKILARKAGVSTLADWPG